MRDSCWLEHPLGSNQLLASVQKLQKYFLQVIWCQLLQTGFPAVSQKQGWWAGRCLYFSRHQQAKLLRSRCSAASCLLKNNCGFSLSFTEPSHSKNAAQSLPTTNPEFPDEWNHLSASQGLCRLSFSRWPPSYFGSQQLKSPKLLGQLPSYFPVPLVGKVPWYCYSAGVWMGESRVCAVLFLWVSLWCDGIWYSGSSPNWA